MAKAVERSETSDGARRGTKEQYTNSEARLGATANFMRVGVRSKRKLASWWVD